MNNIYYKIHPKAFIWLFFIAPLFLFIALLDVFIFNRSFLLMLPKTPEEWSFWLVIFSLPHIISSFITIADHENISRYKKKISRAFLLLFMLSVLINGVIPSIISDAQLYQFHLIVFLIYGFFTIYHITTQQLGIGLLLSHSAPNSNYQAFKWCSIFLSLIMYILILFTISTDNKYLRFMYYGYCLAGVTLMICYYLGYKFAFAIKSKQGVFYIYLNLFMFTTVFLLATLEYFIFALIIPRVIHDVTAFIIYSNHDANKYSIKKNNFIYAKLKSLPVPVWVLSPTLGIAIAFIVNNINPWFALYSVFIFELLHYYIESFIWKKGGTHRSYFKISTLR